MVKTSIADIQVLFTGRDANCQNKANTFLLGLTCVVIPKVSFSPSAMRWFGLWMQPTARYSASFLSTDAQTKTLHSCHDCREKILKHLRQKNLTEQRNKEITVTLDIWLFLALYFYVHITGSSWNNFGKIYTVYKSILQCNISNTWRTASFDIRVQFRFKNHFSIRLNFVTVDVCLMLVFAKCVSVY